MTLMIMLYEVNHLSIRQKLKKTTTLALTAQPEKSGEKYQPGQSSNSLFDSNIILIFGDQLINIW